MNNYARFLCQIGRNSEAEPIFIEAAANPLYPTPDLAITNAGICAYQDERKEDAEKYFRRALEINPKSAIALLQMAQLGFDKKNYLSTRAHLQRYLEVSRHSPSSLWLGIKVENELGDKNALSSYALSLKNNFPDSEEAELLMEFEANR